MFTQDRARAEELRTILGALDLLHGADVEAVERLAGGNMNLVERVRCDDGRTLVVKQARPFVERYPQFPAPVERAEVEAAFARAVGSVPAVAGRMPRLLAHDPQAHRLVWEDLDPLGAGGDGAAVYAGGRLTVEFVDALVDWADALHAVTPQHVAPADAAVLANRLMRELNHAHIFVLPFAAEAPRPLDEVLPGLEALRREQVAVPDVQAAAAELGAHYLTDGAALVHGDLYPGSWISTGSGWAVLDAEFGFFGDPDLDLGVLAGHLVLSEHDPALVQRVLRRGGERVRAFAGVEILRRLFGVAQLPLTTSLATREAQAVQGVAWLTGG